MSGQPCPERVLAIKERTRRAVGAIAPRAAPYHSVKVHRFHDFGFNIQDGLLSPSYEEMMEAYYGT
jgi:hypothetical protein